MKLITRPIIEQNNLFDELFSPLFSNLNNHTFLKTDISKRNDNYVFDIDVPGYLKEDIKISLEDSYLKVKVIGTKTTTHCTIDEYEILHQERYNGQYERSYYIGHNNSKNINATYHNGVLTIVIPINDNEHKHKEKYIEIM